MTARLRLITGESSLARDREQRLLAEERYQRFVNRLLLERGTRLRLERQRERRRKWAKLGGFFLVMAVAVFSLAAPYTVLREAALRMAQAATVFASLLVIGLVIKTAGDAARLSFVRPTKDGSSAGTEVPKGE